MKTALRWGAISGIATLLIGCKTYPPGAERGPHGTIAYDVLIEASEPGARIEANGTSVGNTPVRIKIFGDTDGTFHDFGSYQYVIRAYPLTTNQHPQMRVFATGRSFTPEDRIPQNVYFDMNQKQPALGAGGAPVYVTPPGYYGAPYYGPPGYYYPPPYYPGYGPSVRFYFGPPGPYYHFHHGHR